MSINTIIDANERHWTRNKKKLQFQWWCFSSIPCLHGTAGANPVNYYSIIIIVLLIASIKWCSTFLLDHSPRFKLRTRPLDVHTVIAEAIIRKRTGGSCLLYPCSTSPCTAYTLTYACLFKFLNQEHLTGDTVVLYNTYNGRLRNIRQNIRVKKNQYRIWFIVIFRRLQVIGNICIGLVKYYSVINRIIYYSWVQDASQWNSSFFFISSAAIL